MALNVSGCGGFGRLGYAVSAGVVMFAASFSNAFQRPVLGCIGPMMAQAALANGAAWRMRGNGAVIGALLLIGPAGKTYAFASPASAALWVENARNIGIREQSLIAEIAAAAAAAWKIKKREKLAVIAGRLVDAAARQADDQKRVALLAESDYCLSKWG